MFRRRLLLLLMLFLDETVTQCLYMVVVLQRERERERERERLDTGFFAVPCSRQLFLWLSASCNQAAELPTQGVNITFIPFRLQGPQHMGSGVDRADPDCFLAACCKIR